MNKWFLLFLFIPAIAHAKFYSAQGPITMRTQGPVYLQTVNLNPTRAQVLTPGVFELRVDSSYSNLYERETSATADVNMDMELWHLNWVGTYGVFPDFEIGFELPLIEFNGGFLDSFIQNYHDFFGFPNGGRNFIPNGTFNYKISKNGQVVYQVGSQSLNVGDLTLFTKHQILSEGDLNPAVAWRFALKFPSGDPDKGLGDGNVGFGLGLALEKSYRRLHGYLNLNYLVEGGNESLQGLMADQFFDFTLAGEYSFSDRTSGIIQLTGGTPRLRGTGLGTWDGMPLDFIVGVRGDVPTRGYVNPFFWQVGFSEDIRAVGPSVDFTVLFSIGLHFPVGNKRLYQGDFFGSLL